MLSLLYVPMVVVNDVIILLTSCFVHDKRKIRLIILLLVKAIVIIFIILSSSISKNVHICSCSGSKVLLLYCLTITSIRNFYLPTVISRLNVVHIVY